MIMNCNEVIHGIIDGILYFDSNLNATPRNPEFNSHVGVWTWYEEPKAIWKKKTPGNSCFVFFGGRVSGHTQIDKHKMNEKVLQVQASLDARNCTMEVS